jgi:hypothetical protein
MFMFPQESGPAQTGYDTGKRFGINIPNQEVAHARCVSTATQFKTAFFFFPRLSGVPSASILFTLSVGYFRQFLFTYCIFYIHKEIKNGRR